MTQTNPLQADAVVEQRHIDFVEDFGEAWLDGSRSAKTVLLAKLIKYERDYLAIPLQGGVDVRALLVAFEDFLNEPPRRWDTEPMDVRDYRHEAYRKWAPLCQGILAALRPTPSGDEIIERCAVKADEHALYEGYGPEAYRAGWECASETIATEIRKMKGQG